MTTATPTQLVNAANCGMHSTREELKELAKSMTGERLRCLLIISTKFMGPTDTKGARIKATINGTKVSRTVGYDYGLHTLDAHAYAAFYLLSSWFGGESLQYQGHDETSDGKGWCFVFRFV